MFKKLFGKIFKVPEYKPCPECDGKGQVWIYRKPDNIPDIMDTLNACPICGGKGKVRTFIKKERP